MPRWSKEKDDKLRKLFEEGKADPRTQSSEEIRKVWSEHYWLKEPMLKNFYPLYRRKADEWITEQAKSGSHHKYTPLLALSSIYLSSVLTFPFILHRKQRKEAVQQPCKRVP